LAPAHHEPFGVGQFGGPAERTTVLGPQTTWLALALDVGHAVRCPQAVPTVRGPRSGSWEILCSPFRFFLRIAHGPSVFLTRSLSYCATQHTSVPAQGSPALPGPGSGRCVGCASVLLQGFGVPLEAQALSTHPT